jgi:hypothetical protein
VSAVAEVLAGLPALDRAALAVRWESVFGVPAPKRCQAMLLRQALAWHAQMQALKTSVGSREAERANSALRQAAAARRASTLSPGTRLLREWQGRTHHVTVVAGGFEYDGRIWRSLSAIAHDITGTRWSGPLFFGVRA